MATARSMVLDISNLDEVIAVLRKYHYSGAKLYELGLSLGLLAPTLDVIKANNTNNASGYLLECLSTWLRQADKVKSKGGPTYVTLIAALRSIGEIVVADAIEREKCNFDGNSKEEKVQNDQDCKKSLELREREERQELKKEVVVLSSRLQAVEARLILDDSLTRESQHLNKKSTDLGVSTADTVSKRQVQDNTFTVNDDDGQSVGGDTAGTNQSTVGGDTATANTGVYVERWRKYPVEQSAREVMIIGSFGVELQYHMSPKLIPSDLDKLSDQWKREEIDSIRKLYQKNPEKYPLRFVCHDLPLAERPKKYHLEMIKDLFINCKQDGVIIHYTGHGERKTGNWCFKDGVITFQDIFGFYMDHLRGKSLTIVSDCSYSGNWINECIKKLDEIGIPSCGHHTREQGVLLKIFTSCQPNEEATALCYSKEAFYYNEEKKSPWHLFGKKLTSGQTTMHTDFRDIRCSKPADESCEADSTCTWDDRFGNKARLAYLIRGKDEGRQAWHYVLVDEDKLDEFKAKITSGTIDVADYGKVLCSGWGKDPPKDIVRKIDLQYRKYINP